MTYTTLFLLGLVPLGQLAWVPALAARRGHAAPLWFLVVALWWMVLGQGALVAPVLLGVFSWAAAGGAALDGKLLAICAFYLVAAFVPSVAVAFLTDLRRGDRGRATRGRGSR